MNAIDTLDDKPQFRQSMLSGQACVPEDWTDEQVLEFVGPSGTTNGWQIRKQGDELLNGADERVKCAGRDGFIHIMLDC